ncbi:MAG: GNAT family N-acetyltransferase [Promethearchaeota archaeon]
MIIQLTDKKIIYNHLKKDVFLFAYHIGDLDDFFFPDCIWYGLIKEKILHEIGLLYTGLSVPVLLIQGISTDISVLLRGIFKDLPKKFFCHYMKDLEQDFLTDYKMTYLGTYLKMKFLGFTKGLAKTDTSGVVRLREKNESEVLAYYQEASPDSYFESFMLATGKYFGIRQDGKLKSVAGVHVYSEKYKVATLGNIVTHPNIRRKGLARQCVTKLLEELVTEVDHIGLNVRADNLPAINLYKQLGFIEHAEYEEALFERIE